MPELLGWLSSLLLLITLGTQIAKQWRERSSEGVSGSLFVGQTLSSLGFAAYSALIGNWVFTVTNSLLVLSGLAGWMVTRHFQSRASGRQRHPS